MATDKQIIEAKGIDVQDAIVRGLETLGVSKEQATIEVLDEGSRGILGLGKRDAVVRMTAQLRAAEVIESSQPAPVEDVATPADLRIPDLTVIAPGLPAQDDSPASKAKAMTEQHAAVEAETEVEAELSEEAEVARDILETLLSKMGVTASVTSRFSGVDDVSGQRIPILEVQGQDLSALIGTHGDTLSTMQYLVRLMASHKLKRRTNFVIDVEGYRERRTQALQRLSQRMARKAIKRGQAVTLEPMPANERRTIHITLRDHDEVYTESIGEGSERRVRILLRD